LKVLALADELVIQVHRRVRYLLGLARRLELASNEDTEDRYDELVRGLQKLIDAVTRVAES
jgi:hypothetical protein